jgi:hypothetical protein
MMILSGDCTVMTTYHVDTLPVALAEEFRKAEIKVAAGRGDFALFGLFQTEDVSSRWDLVAAAPWLDALPTSGIKEVIDAVSEHFSVKDWKIISVVVTMKTNSNFAQAMTRKFHLEHEMEEIGNTYVNGVFISHAFLITSNANPAPARVMPELTAA